MSSQVSINEKFDFLLLNIARECGDINGFMNLFFSFLLRKTDFITNSKNVEQCEEVVLKTLRKYYKQKDEYIKKMKKEYEKMDAEKKKTYEKENLYKNGVNNNKSNITDSSNSTTNSCNNNNIVKDVKTMKENNKIKNENNFSKEIKEDKNTPLQTTKNQPGEKSNEQNKTSSDNIQIEKNINNSLNNKTIDNKKSNNIKKVKNKSNDSSHNKNIPESDSESESEPPKGNGGKTEKYTWTQTINSLDMYIDLKEKMRTKDIKVDITYKKLCITIKNKNFINGEFYKHIKPEDSIWTLEDNQVIHLSIEKLNGMEWWATVIKGDNEIDVKKIVPENSRMEDLDLETRSVVEKMLYDQKQKAMNLPTSEEQKKFEIFEKFKKMHPEMDFSKANINYGNSSPNNMFFGQ
ncbi:nuclear movement protein, putative [Hepatocystis sp. ex Piliocolobus tephrosceles]|nr:nuclear movement protein, putative [Hepatocystis sp. ex Piliocolobus tephrosceles]